MSIGKKLALLFLLLSLAPALAVGILAYDNSERSLRSSLGDNFRTRAAETVDKINRTLRKARLEAATWASLDTLQLVLTDDVDGKVTTFLVGLLRNHDDYAELSAFNGVGEVVASGNPDLIGRSTNAGGCLSAVMKGESCIRDAAWDTASGEWVVAFSFPVRASFERSRVIGGLVAKWKVSQLSQLAGGSLADSASISPSHVVVARNDGLVLSSPSYLPGWVYSRNLNEMGFDSARLAVDGSVGYRLETAMNGDQVLAGYAGSSLHPGSSKFGWFVLVLQDARGAFAPVDDLKRMFMWVASIALILVVALSLFVSRRFTAPVIDLSSAAGRVANGDFVGIPARSSGDEIGTLTRDFNRMVENLKQQRAQLVDKDYVDSIIDHMLDALIVTTEKGQIKTVNRALTDMVGLGEEELVGRPFGELTREGDEWFREEVVERAKSEGGVRELTAHLKGRTGIEIPVNLSARVMRDGKGFPHEVLCTAMDMTERISAAEERSWLASFPEQNPDAVMEVDSSGNVTYSNASARKRFPNLETQAASHPLLADLADIPAELAGREAGTVLRHVEFMDCHYELSISSVPGTTRLRIHAADVSERRKLEEQLLQSQKMQAVGTLAGGVAHDFNNLLNAILGFSHLASESLAASDPLRENIDEIIKAGERAATLTRQLLAFSRKQVLQPVSLSLNSTVDNMRKMLSRIIGEDIQFQTDLSPELPTAKADPGQLEQVLVNLVVNARDAMPVGGRLFIKTDTVSLDDMASQAIEGAREGTFARLSVTDSGSGMDRETAARIFEPFFTTKGLGKGTGLGLSTVFGIVEQHHGWINVYSEPGVGTTFRVYLPAISNTYDGEVGIEADLWQGGSGERILLVEDEEQVRKFASLALKRYGYEVFPAASAKAAEELFDREAGEFDLIFSDVVLPDTHGPELVKKLLAIRPDLPVVMCSGYSDQKSQWPLIESMDCPFLQKPYSIADLMTALAKALQGAGGEFPREITGSFKIT